MARKFLLMILYDLLIFPIQALINFFYEGNKQNLKFLLNSKNRLAFDNDELRIFIHHYAPRGLSSKKTIDNKIYNVGIGNILKQANSLNLDCWVFVADSDNDYYAKLALKYPSLKFFKTNSACLDFGSYIDGAKKELLETDSKVKYYCMMNDNIDCKSDLKTFLYNSVSSFNRIPSLSLIGVGTNSEVRQSILQKAFHPHIQTFCFVVKKQLFNNFFKINDIEKIKSTKFFKKQIICRIFEQGLSSFLLKKGLSFAIFKDKQIILYNRTVRLIDLKKDWFMVNGDSRIKSNNPFLIDRGINE
tara:strand:+ start:24810 stop:25715 length:906 start_codon:yes stop_codon:yes gene_type:complete